MTADRLTILHVYPRQMGVSGDRGNVAAIVRRAAAADIATEVVEYAPGDVLPTTADIVVIGNGPLSAMRSLGADVTRIAEPLRALAASGVPVVAVGGGFDLATNEVVPTEGAPVQGFGVFDARAVRGAERRVNYFVLDTRYPLLPGAPTRLAGFEDHATRIELADGVVPFADVVSGGGNQAGSPVEGAIVGTSFGTHTQGPILPLNPQLTDGVLAAATTRLGREYAPDPERTAAIDRYAREARATVDRYVDKAFKRIA
ncbi:glutamine amidotransferase [Curtobacterium sp. MCLR17_036]|uniref:type 1 glutamine amidotransferase n=1 Tax=Curtobacterium sp. MCLR17_036 TaxID=2175620 RepID=UPI000DA7F013|nr:glutamine amidotransferase [Curtobacterium sp. MCLR17_036]WIE66500.1 glutamine amidotransferase [Curtobacterium sp. MCLR17_036]